MAPMTPIVLLLGIVIIVLLMALCWMIYRFYNFMQSLMTYMRSDIIALRNKFCDDLDPSKRKEYLPGYPDFLPPPHGIPPPDFDVSSDFEPRIPFEMELKGILKRKPNWSRNELLDELGISYKEEDWR